tara:strand:+ start:680 stop:976 length:297 start_codon:yes stop_codon:yes gene_type:complete
MEQIQNKTTKGNSMTLAQQLNQIVKDFYQIPLERMGDPTREEALATHNAIVEIREANIEEIRAAYFSGTKGAELTQADDNATALSHRIVRTWGGIFTA